MELQHINVKLYLRDPHAVKMEAVVPVFHDWIQHRACEELLIDVADYRHVHAGPGVVLIGHQADYSFDNTDSRLGIRYNRKAVVEGSNRNRFSQALRAACRACQKLESDEKLGGTVCFDGRGIQLFVNDRILAPNRAHLAEAVGTELREFFADALGSSEFEMRFERDPRRLFGAEVTAAKPLELGDLLERLN